MGGIGMAAVGREAASGVAEAIISGIVPVTARLAVILVLVFLLKVTIDITRYYFRVAEHLDAFAYALEIAPADPDKLMKVAAAMGVGNIQFGPMPDSISDKALDVVKAALSKGEK